MTRWSDSLTMRRALEHAFGDDGASPPCVGFECDEPTVHDTHFCQAHLDADIDDRERGDGDFEYERRRDRDDQDAA